MNGVGAHGASSAPQAAATATATATATVIANGTVPLIKRRLKKPAANPFASARQPGKATLPNGQLVKDHMKTNTIKTTPALTATQRPSASVGPRLTNAIAITHLNPNQYSGFSDPAVLSQSKPYTDYKLVASKKDLLDGLRYHIMQLTGDKTVDIRDAAQFPPPAHLHRRDPRTAPPGAPKDDDHVEIKDGLNEAERAAQKDRNEQRKIERAANLAQIAPTQASRKVINNKTRTKVVYKHEYTEEEKRRIQTNYEEKLPWHLEDFDNKFCLLGQNQAPSMNRHVALAYEPAIDSQTGKFRLVPVEKIYEFAPKKAVKPTLSLEEVEARMSRKGHLPEWLEQVEYKAEARKKQQKRDDAPRIYTGENKNDKLAGRSGEDVDLDFDDDELFADDEEGDNFAAKDEDEALAEKRIKEDQLKANFFEVKEEKEYDDEEQKELDEERDRKENFRRIRRALEKHEHNYNHASDSEYSSSSDDEEDQERERADAEKRKQLEAQRLEPESSNRLTAPPSGATTPSARREKILSDREGVKIKRKRPGSPDLSEAGSGTDTSTRKKPKVKHLSSTQPVSRSDTPTGQRLKIRGPGAGSDTDAGAVSDTATRRLKLKHKSSNLPSRAASPAPNAAASRSAAASPPAEVSRMPSLDEMRDVLRRHPSGITMAEFVKVVPHDRKSEIGSLLRQMGVKLISKEDGKKYLVLVENVGSASPLNTS